MTKQQANPSTESPSGPTPKRDSREALLDAGERLFTEQSFAEVGTREIAEAAGVNLGLIQYHFGSKANLFVAVVHRMKERASYQPAMQALSRQDGTPIGAAAAIAGFAREYVESILHPCGPQACRLIFREVLGDPEQNPEMLQALISTIAEDFMGPVEQSLVEAIKVLQPGESDEKYRLQAHCVMGVCNFYANHRPFIERLRGEDFSCCVLFERMWPTIARFALRALGCADALIDKAIETVRVRERAPSG